MCAREVAATAAAAAKVTRSACDVTIYVTHQLTSSLAPAIVAAANLSTVDQSVMNWRRTSCPCAVSNSLPSRRARPPVNHGYHIWRDGRTDGRQIVEIDTYVYKLQVVAACAQARATVTAAGGRIHGIRATIQARATHRATTENSDAPDVTFGKLLNYVSSGNGWNRGDVVM